MKDEEGNIVYRKKRGETHLPELEKEAVLTLDEDKSNLLVESIRMHYTDKPMAIFMLTPDYDPSNHIIVSIFLSQLYKELPPKIKIMAINRLTKIFLIFGGCLLIKNFKPK